MIINKTFNCDKSHCSHAKLSYIILDTVRMEKSLETCFFGIQLTYVENEWQGKKKYTVGVPLHLKRVFWALTDKRQKTKQGKYCRNKFGQLVAHHRNDVLQSAEIWREQIERNVKEVTGWESRKIQLIGVHIAPASWLATLSFRLFAIPEKNPQNQGWWGLFDLQQKSSSSLMLCGLSPMQKRWYHSSHLSHCTQCTCHTQISSIYHLSFGPRVQSN